VRKVAQEFGRLDILVNNAGVFVTGAVQEAVNNRAELDRQFAINAEVSLPRYGQLRGS
jgi:3-oxoacyl-[acyl-carrier protein] reductase